MVGTRSRRHVVAILTAAVPAGLLAACQGQAAAPTPAPAPVSAKLILMADMVQAGKNLTPEQAKTRDCVMTNRFPRNGAIAWRVRVHDPRTGDPMDDKALKSVQVRLSNGANVDLAWKARPKDPPNETFWQGSWLVPKETPTGSFKYAVVAAANDGRTGRFELFPVPESLPVITEETLADAPVEV